MKAKITDIQWRSNDDCYNLQHECNDSEYYADINRIDIDYTQKRVDFYLHTGLHYALPFYKIRTIDSGLNRTEISVATYDGKETVIVIFDNGRIGINFESTNAPQYAVNKRNNFVI